MKIEFDFENLKKKGVKRVGLQLPNGLKPKSREISDQIEEKGFEVIISGKGTFGACDIDLDLLKEVDALLHFAHTPIFEISKVYFVPYRIDFDLKVLNKVKIKERKIALISTAQYAWKLGKVKQILANRGYDVKIGRGSSRVKYPGQVLGCNYTVLRNLDFEAVLFIGDGLFHPLGAAIYTGKKVYRLDLVENKFELVRCDSFLKKRFAQIVASANKKKGAILVSSKIGQKRLNLALRLKKIAKNKGIKLDVIYMDEIYPSKLLNFGYEYYVNTACPRISYDDSEYYGVPILSPQEFEIMIGVRSWENYQIDEIQ